VKGRLISVVPEEPGFAQRKAKLGATLWSSSFKPNSSITLQPRWDFGPGHPVIGKIDDLWIRDPESILQSTTEI
jgi:hypothetical protein